ncbi:hypothetical protein DFH28DRAFT_1080798 [Melampsora americana]|nr:hypothetical protein DFH28DRAFT_1089504 [Melampsora americana]KAH9808275.1 hypothetical protein DFH28DRAFT_1087981 [Melampsora americana]KAH9818328.1 hypothetical protein DFH28DRAFT_1080798 [Melampsora americana]
MASWKSSPYHLPCEGCISKVTTRNERVSVLPEEVQQPKTNRSPILRLSETSERPPENVPLTYAHIVNTVPLWRSVFLFISTYLNLAAIVTIWLASRYTTGRFAECLKHWTPDFLPSAWGNIIQSRSNCYIFIT